MMSIMGSILFIALFTMGLFFIVFLFSMAVSQNRRSVMRGMHAALNQGEIRRLQENKEANQYDDSIKKR